MLVLLFPSQRNVPVISKDECIIVEWMKEIQVSVVTFWVQEVTSGPRHSRIHSFYTSLHYALLHSQLQKSQSHQPSEDDRIVHILSSMLVIVTCGNGREGLLCMRWCCAKVYEKKRHIGQIPPSQGRGEIIITHFSTVG
jgi:hypothetical protein